MNKPTRTLKILLYGNSTCLTGIAANLSQCPGLAVTSTDADDPGPQQDLAALNPDVIIFDAESAHPQPALSWLSQCPHLSLIGVGPSSDQMLLWSGQHSRAVTMKDLIDVINIFALE